jgi:hypothetical protein
MVLCAVIHAWEKEHRGVYSRTLRQELEVEFSQVKDAEKAARVTLDHIADKGLVDKRKTTLEGKGDVVLFCPYGADLSKSDMSALWNTLRTPRTLRSLLNAYNHRKFLFILIFFWRRRGEGKTGSGECLYKSRERCVDSSNQKHQYLL